LVDAITLKIAGRWKSSFSMYLHFYTASKRFAEWVKKVNHKLYKVSGYITEINGMYHLKYAKRETIELFNQMYYNSKVICLKRKLVKLEKAFKLNKKQQLKYTLDK
jgi:hypothetical protein